MSDKKDQEEILGIVKIVDTDLGDLIFTSSRLIFANTSKEFLSSILCIFLAFSIINFSFIGLRIMGFNIEGERLIVQLCNIIIAIGFWSRISTKEKRADRKSKELTYLPLDDILHDSKHNFEIVYAMIRKIEISKSKSKPLMKILTDEKWKKIGHVDKNTCPDYLEMICAALPGKEVEVK